MDGKYCKCAARNSSECCCDVNWTDSETVKKARRQALLDFADIYERGSSGWSERTMRELAETEEFQTMGFDS